MEIITANIYRYVVNPQSATTSINYAHLRRVIDSIMQVLLRIQQHIAKVNDQNIVDKLTGVIQAQYVKLYSRFLSSDLSVKEIKQIHKTIHYTGIPAPNHRLLKILYRYPLLIKIMRWPYRCVFMRYIHPRLKRN